MRYVVQYSEELYGPFGTYELALYWIAAQHTGLRCQYTILYVNPVT